MTTRVDQLATLVAQEERQQREEEYRREQELPAAGRSRLELTATTLHFYRATSKETPHFMPEKEGGNVMDQLN